MDITCSSCRRTKPHSMPHAGPTSMQRRHVPQKRECIEWIDAMLASLQEECFCSLFSGSLSMGRDALTNGKGPFSGCDPIYSLQWENSSGKRSSKRHRQLDALRTSINSVHLEHPSSDFTFPRKIYTNWNTHASILCANSAAQCLKCMLHASIL